jgi:hypothetical protein
MLGLSSLSPQKRERCLMPRKQWLYLGLALTMLGAKPASAQELVVGSGWQVFSWSGSAFSSPWTSFQFSPAGPSVVRITDCCTYGDQFRLSWTGTTSGFFDTSIPSGVGFGSIDPDVSYADPLNSSGSASFGPGNYTFSLELLSTAQGFSFGDGWIIADAGTDIGVVPEPATLSLLATGLVGLAGARRRKLAAKQT